MANKKTMRCAFCGKTSDDVSRMLSGNNVYICNECVDLCYSLIHDTDFPDMLEDGYGKRPAKQRTKKPKVLKPREIKEILDQYVIGQDAAKVVLSVSVYNHYKRLENNYDAEAEVELQKSNVLLLGPSGVGKTYLAQTLAKALDVPFAIADATTLTEAGYVGEDVENILLKLIQAADFDIEAAERGIIYIDEIDKITRRSENPSTTRDVGGEGVQQALLKILEGTVASVPPQGGRKNPYQEMLYINTKNILFICGGAFDGIDKIIEQRVSKSSLGFGADIREDSKEKRERLIKQVTSHDLIKFGLIPELVGRLPIVTALDQLDVDSLVRILREPKNSIVKQYQVILGMDGIELEFTEDALREIAAQAKEKGNGARSLRAIMEGLLVPVMFDVSSRTDVKKVTFSEQSVKTGTPEIA